MSNCKWPRCSCKATGVYCAEKAKKTAKKAPKPLVRTRIKPRSEKGQIKAIAKKGLIQTDMVFYLTQIWEVRKHECYVTKEPLHEPKTYNFHHVLEKRPYPEYRHKEWNIILVSWLIHDKIHRNIDNVPKVKKLTEYLKNLHDSGELQKMKDIDIMIKINNFD